MRPRNDKSSFVSPSPAAPAWAVIVLAVLSTPPDLDAAAWPGVGARAGTQRLAASPEGNHTCFALSDGTVRCWGDNGSGQIGDGTSGNTRTTPTPVSGLVNVVSVAAGGAHSCALTAGGRVRCWGSNADGQLGIGSSPAASSTPLEIPDLTNVVSITAGTAHTCARRSDGTVHCWGSNGSRQLGDGSNVQRRVNPVPVSGLADAVVVSAGAAHACAVRVGGQIVCWGDNRRLQLGVTGGGQTRNTPNPISSTDVFTSVSGGGEFTCGRRANGDVLCWGNNDAGQFGNDTVGAPTATPQRVTTSAIAGSDVPGVAVATGRQHACMLTFDQTPALACWGRNQEGQVRPGATSSVERVPRLAAKNLYELVAGRAHTCAVAGSDDVLCWGDNGLGQLGGSRGPIVLALSSGGSVTAKGVSAGSQHTCAWRGNGLAACWGVGSAFSTSNEDALVPTPVNGLAQVTSLTAGTAHTCALEDAAILPLCWGSNQSRQSLPTSSALGIVLPATKIGTDFTIQVSAGSSHGCELTARGTVSCRGSNTSGELGAGVRPFGASVNFVAQVGGFTDVVAVAAGGGHSCAVRANGRVACWGNNAFGQLGVNPASSGAPARDVGLTNAIAITTGTTHSCALLANGAVSCWGLNHFGQVDGSDQQTRPAPTGVSGIAAGEAVAVSAGHEHTCVLQAAGGIRCWGRNNVGQLGNNSTSDSRAPVFVLRPTLFTFDPFGGTQIPVRFGVLNDAVSLEAGALHNCALRANGQPVCWGLNTSGQLGDNTRTDKPYANTVGSFTANVDATAALEHRGRIVTVGVLVSCPVGERFTADVFVAQDGADGWRRSTGRCTGGLATFPVTVPARGARGFETGEALVTAEIVVHARGHVTETQSWTRIVELTAP